MIWFADTSALVKRYISEKGSPWMRAEMVRHDVLVSQLTPIEMAAALVTADEKLEALAIAQGLKTENPSRH